MNKIETIKAKIDKILILNQINEYTLLDLLFDLRSFHSQLLDSDCRKVFVNIIEKSIKIFLLYGKNKKHPQEKYITLFLEGLRVILIGLNTQNVYNLFIKKSRQILEDILENYQDVAAKEFFKFYNLCLANANQDVINYLVTQNSNICVELFNLLPKLFDIEYQLVLVETIFRLIEGKLNDFNCFLDNPDLQYEFKKINLDNPYISIRNFINLFNTKFMNILSVCCDKMIVDGHTIRNAMVNEQSVPIYVDFGNDQISFNCTKNFISEIESLSSYEIIIFPKKKIEKITMKQHAEDEMLEINIIIKNSNLYPISKSKLEKIRNFVFFISNHCPNFKCLLSILQCSFPGSFNLQIETQNISIDKTWGLSESSLLDRSNLTSLTDSRIFLEDEELEKKTLRSENTDQILERVQDKDTISLLSDTIDLTDTSHLDMSLKGQNPDLSLSLSLEELNKELLSTNRNENDNSNLSRILEIDSIDRVSIISKEMYDVDLNNSITCKVTQWLEGSKENKNNTKTKQQEVIDLSKSEEENAEKSSETKRKQKIIDNNQKTKNVLKQQEMKEEKINTKIIEEEINGKTKEQENKVGEKPRDEIVEQLPKNSGNLRKNRKDEKDKKNKTGIRTKKTAKCKTDTKKLNHKNNKITKFDATSPINITEKNDHIFPSSDNNKTDFITAEIDEPSTHSVTEIPPKDNLEPTKEDQNNNKGKSKNSKKLNKKDFLKHKISKKNMKSAKKSLTTNKENRISKFVNEELNNKSQNKEKLKILSENNSPKKIETEIINLISDDDDDMDEIVKSTTTEKEINKKFRKKRQSRIIINRSSSDESDEDQNQNKNKMLEPSNTNSKIINQEDDENDLRTIDEQMEQFFQEFDLNSNLQNKKDLHTGKSTTLNSQEVVNILSDQNVETNNLNKIDESPDLIRDDKEEHFMNSSFRINNDCKETSTRNTSFSSIKITHQLNQNMPVENPGSVVDEIITDNDKNTSVVKSLDEPQGLVDISNNQNKEPNYSTRDSFDAIDEIPLCNLIIKKDKNKVDVSLNKCNIRSDEIKPSNISLSSLESVPKNKNITLKYFESSSTISLDSDDDYGKKSIIKTEIQLKNNKKNQRKTKKTEIKKEKKKKTEDETKVTKSTIKSEKTISNSKQIKGLKKKKITKEDDNNDVEQQIINSGNYDCLFTKKHESEVILLDETFEKMKKDYYASLSKHDSAELLSSIIADKIGKEQKNDKTKRKNHNNNHDNRKMKKAKYDTDLDDQSFTEKIENGDCDSAKPKINILSNIVVKKGRSRSVKRKCSSLDCNCQTLLKPVFVNLSQIILNHHPDFEEKSRKIKKMVNELWDGVHSKC